MALRTMITFLVLTTIPNRYQALGLKPGDALTFLFKPSDLDETADPESVAYQIASGDIPELAPAICRQKKKSDITLDLTARRRFFGVTYAPGKPEPGYRGPTLCGVDFEGPQNDEAKLLLGQALIGGHLGPHLLPEAAAPADLTDTGSDDDDPPQDPPKDPPKEGGDQNPPKDPPKEGDDQNPTKTGDQTPPPVADHGGKTPALG